MNLASLQWMFVLCAVVTKSAWLAPQDRKPLRPVIASPQAAPGSLMRSAVHPWSWSAGVAGCKRLYRVDWRHLSWYHFNRCALALAPFSSPSERREVKAPVQVARDRRVLIGTAIGVTFLHTPRLISNFAEARQDMYNQPPEGNALLFSRCYQRVFFAGPH